MINIESYTPTQGTLTAVCRNTHDSWNNTDTQQLSIGKTYEVEYAIIGRSWTMVCLKEFPNELYNSAMFNFYINGEDIRHIATDYRALKRMTNDNYHETTTLIYRSLSEARIAEIKELRNNTRILIRSELLK
ncbi:hypothetical protein [uncultured Duncaniella sp.]|uniref:hypothetical protein n=1 Tax=uncultured Duncaniella sp. TaxID=2768039 RepID=UPI002711D267|nr:hypothetical protein [uncultured Duncaniella sp.]